LPGSRFDKGFRIAVGVKAFLKNLTSGIARGETQDTPEQRENRPRNQKSTRQRMRREHKKKIKSIRRELSEKKRERSQIGRELLAASRAVDNTEHKKQIRRAKSIRREIFLLSNELCTAKARTDGEPETGSLPGFVIIGAPKCGTTYLYHLLSKHPHVEPAACKETHYFNLLFEKGTEWYRQCFLPSRQKDGQWTITGEATPDYLFHPHVAKRMARVIPEARLIALLRNPVDRMYSDYHFFLVRHGRQKGTFEETIAAYLDRPHENRVFEPGNYVDHLLRWARFFSREQILVLKSEDFFERPQQTLKRVLDFLELPDWEPEASALRDKLNKGSYEQTMDPSVRQRLEEYFEPHNRRLYEFLGVDFGW
jgi:hypothetical protein